MKITCILVVICMLGAATDAAMSEGATLPLPTSLAFLVAGLGGLVLTRLLAD